MHQPSKLPSTAVTYEIPHYYSAYRPVVQKEKYEIEFLDERYQNEQLSSMDQPSLLTKFIVTCLAVIAIGFCLYKLFIKT